MFDARLLGWVAAADAAVTMTFAEVLAGNAQLVAQHGDELGADVMQRFRVAMTYGDGALAEAQAAALAWRADLARVFEGVDLLALPAMGRFPTRLDDGPVAPNPMASAVSLAGHPALCLPVPTPGRFPASVQLVGPDNAEDRLVVAAALLEGAVAAG